MIPSNLLLLLDYPDYGLAGTGVVNTERRAVIGEIRIVPRIRGVVDIVPRVCGEVRVRPRIGVVGGSS